LSKRLGAKEFKLGPVTPLMAVRLVWGGLLVGFPGALERVAGSRPSDTSWRVVARLLGARHLAEVALELRGTRERTQLAAVVDSLHALSVTAYVALDRRHRRAALLDALMAWGFATWSWRSVAGGGADGLSPVLIGSQE